MPEPDAILAWVVGTLVGGLSTALFNYIKFNGRIIWLETTVKEHIIQEKEWHARIEAKLDKILAEKKAALYERRGKASTP